MRCGAIGQSRCPAAARTMLLAPMDPLHPLLYAISFFGPPNVTGVRVWRTSEGWERYMLFIEHGAGLKGSCVWSLSPPPKKGSFPFCFLAWRGGVMERGTFLPALLIHTPGSNTQCNLACKKFQLEEGDSWSGGMNFM
jgi:hypothetical protein